MKRIILVTIVSYMIIFLSSCKKNQPPIIDNIIANPDSIGPGETTTLFADAHDADNDELVFSWSSAYGSFSSPDSQSTIWTAPNSQGNNTITLIAEDEHGAQDQASVSIKVGGSSLTTPSVSYEVQNYGMILHLYWVAIPTADGYYIYADGNRVYSTTSNSYDASSPAIYYAISAYRGTAESQQDTVDCSLVVTSNINVWGWTDPDPNHPSGMGFDVNGVAVALSTSDSINRPYIDYYFDDGNYPELTMVSPHVHNYNNKVDRSVNSGLTDFHALTIADSTNNYYIENTLVSNAVYALWMDPNNNGWDPMVDHFAKMKVVAIYGSSAPYQAVLTFAFQRIHGLRWLVTQ